MFMTGLDRRDSALGAATWSGGYTSMASKGTATWAAPAGPQTATQAGFGTIAGGSGAPTRVTVGVLTVGTLALVGLIALWYSLPK